MSLKNKVFFTKVGNESVFVNPEHIATLKDGGWVHDNSGEINMQKVLFFRHKEHPKSVLKYYPEKGGFMVSNDIGTPAVYHGKTVCRIPYHPVEKFAEVIKKLQ